MTIDQFKADLRSRGITTAQWADEHGFARILVYRTLAGVIKGHFGIGHQILVAAGVKSNPDRKAA